MLTFDIYKLMKSCRDENIPCANYNFHVENAEFHMTWETKFRHQNYPSDIPRFLFGWLGLSIDDRAGILSQVEHVACNRMMGFGGEGDVVKKGCGEERLLDKLAE